MTKDAVDTSTQAVERLADKVRPVHLDLAAVDATLRALLAERDTLAADLRRATEAARAADERCARYDELVERLQRENDALRALTHSD